MSCLNAAASRVRCWSAARALVLLPAVGLLLLWVIIRIPELTNWTQTFRPTLEYDSANAARTVWYTLHPDLLDAGQRAWLEASPGRFIEPPLLQFLTALTYLPDGVERPWTSAVFTSAAWLLASVLLFDIGRRRASLPGSVLALAYFLFAPFGLAVSRSFQVDALAMLGLAATVWYAERGDFLSDTRRFATVVLIAGTAGLLKPGPSLPILVGVLAAFGLEGGGLMRKPRRALLLVLAICLAMLPAVAYALVMLRDQVGPKLIPELLATRGFYDGWLHNAANVAGRAPLIAALVGFALAPRLRGLGLGLLGGYVATSLAFTWHTMTHDYYQVPLLLITAIGLAGFIAAAQRLSQGRTLAIGIAMLSSAATSVPLMHLPAPTAAAPTSDTIITRDAPVFEALGERISRGERVLAYSYNYALPLMYYSGLVVDYWPTGGDLAFEASQEIEKSAEQRLDAARAAGIRYFIVTDGISGATGVRSLLESRAAPECTGETIWVFDLAEEPGSGGGRGPAC